MERKYYDIILNVTPNIQDITELNKELGRGQYSWVFDNKMNRKLGQIVPGANKLFYNIVSLEDGDYVLQISINNNDMMINVGHVDKKLSDIKTVYNVTSNIGTIGERMLINSVPINGFKEYLSMAIDLRCEYLTEEDIVVKEDNIENDIIASKLNKLKGTEY